MMFGLVNSLFYDGTEAALKHGQCHANRQEHGGAGESGHRLGQLAAVRSSARWQED